MADPLVPQGFLNRLNAAIYITNFPSLNVMPSNVGRGGISLAFDGDATTSIPTMAGRVQSPEPWVGVTITARLLRTQALANLYKLQIENGSTVLGGLTVYPDISLLSAGIGAYNILNGAIARLPELSFAGSDASWDITLTGYYDINANLWNGG